MTAESFLAASPLRRRTLSDEHRNVLIHGSGILPGVIQARGYYSLKPAAVKILAAEKVVGDYVLTASSWLGIPVYRPDGTYHCDVLRLFGAPGKPKYVWPNQTRLAVDVHPDLREYLMDTSIPIGITEGIRKTDALYTAALGEGIDFIPLSIQGCWAWKSSTSKGVTVVCPDFLDIPMKDREIFIISDSDFRTNDDVRRGWTAAAEYFASKSNKTRSRLIVVPPMGLEKQGADDFLLAGNSLQDLLSAAATPGYAALEQANLASTKPPLSFRTGTQLISTALEEVPYIMPPLLPEGSILLMAGHSGALKTWHALDLMLDGAFGYAWTDHPGVKQPATPFTTIYVNKEMGEQMLGVRLRQLAKAKRYHDHPDYEQIMQERVIIVDEPEFNLNDPLERQRIEDLIQATGAKLVILDSLSMCWTGDENSASEVAEFYISLRSITGRQNNCWWLIHHLVKPAGSKAKEANKFAVRGSGQIIQQADSALLVALLDSDNTDSVDKYTVLTHAKTRTSVEMQSWVTKFETHDGLYYSINYTGLMSEVKAREYTSSGGDPGKFAEWIVSALTPMTAMHPSGSGLRTKQLVALLQASWPVTDKEKTPSISTIRRHLDNMVTAGDMEIIAHNKRVGDLYRLTDEPRIIVAEEDPV